jgi:3-hydroxyisobutyrate dehydrogenase-like beta-hydroxyacid dehydrogenase
MRVVGVVGLGAMGGELACRLLNAGNEVHGTNRTAAKAQPLIARGLQWHDTPREVAAASDVVISMVTNDAALQEITDGPDGIVAGLWPRSVYVDMSSVSPRRASRLPSGFVRRAQGCSMPRSPAASPRSNGEL